MTLRDFSRLGNRPTNKGKNAHRGFSNVFVGEAGKGIDPLHVEGLFDAGHVVNIPDFANKASKEAIKTGYPKGLLLNIPTDEAQELSWTFDMYRLHTLQIATANTAASIINYATGGQTTISSATKSSGTVAVATGLHAGDTVIVGTKHATYGGYDEMTIITKITDTAVEFEPLSVVPANGATFKKVAGKITGTNKTNTGIIIPKALTVEFPRITIVTVNYITSAKSLMVTHIPELEVFEGSMPNYNETLAKCSFTGSAIMQDEKSFTMLDGSTESLPWFAEYYIIPYESANT